jgi:catechol 2,3-dioxygenase
MGWSSIPAMLEPQRIGHVVLKVRDLDRALGFYRDLLGFRVVNEMSNVMVFLTATGENHHDLGLLRVGDSAPSPVATSVGLYHVAVQLADWDAVRRAHALLSERGLLKGSVDHGVSRSLYTVDPDGNEIELYCDAPRDEWEGRVDRVMTVRPLRME